MLVRHPVVAGRFYPANARDLRCEVQDWLTAGAAENTLRQPEKPAPDKALFALMLPHAGYVYCGKVLGATLAETALPRSLILLCPNHTGQGEALGVWPEGAWLTPLGPVPVDADLAARLTAAEAQEGSIAFRPDTLCHLGEHSLEVILPFLQCLPQFAQPEHLCIVPLCVGTQQPAALRAAGRVLTRVLQEARAGGKEVALIVSSDMNHYEDQARTLQKDDLALQKALACDAEGLLATVAKEKISMCGAGPLALALFAAHALGTPRARLSLHDTSATASGDKSHVVGYAGLRISLEPGAGPAR